MTEIHEIHGKIKVKWKALTQTAIDHWSTMALVNLNKFRTMVLENGLKHAVSNRSYTWNIGDPSAKVASNREIQVLIDSEVFLTFAKANIKYYLLAFSSGSPQTNLSAKKSPDQFRSQRNSTHRSSNRRRGVLMDQIKSMIMRHSDEN